MSEQPPFQASFAEYYDLLYQDKDYNRECALIDTVIERYAKGASQTVLDLGCGTGNHSLRLAERSFSVCGVDRSEAMLGIARGKTPPPGAKAIQWRQADLRQLELGQTFDLALALFAVLCFQLGNQDLEAALLAIRRHLRPGGLFLLDVWYGPTVLRHRPEKRLKIMEDDQGRRLLRYAVPQLDSFAHTNETAHHALVIDQKSGTVIADFRETQKIRFFFPQEISFFLEKAGFEVLRMFPFPNLDGAMTEDDWDLGIIARLSPRAAP